MPANDARMEKLATWLEEAAPRGRTMLLPALHYAQSLYGWLPAEVQEAVSRALKTPLADVHGVEEFYSMFYSIINIPIRIFFKHLPQTAVFAEGIGTFFF